MGDLDITWQQSEAFSAFQNKLVSIGAGEQNYALNDALGGACTDLVRLGFQDGTDPDGNAWVETQAGNDPPLTGEGDLAASAAWEASDEGFTLLVNDWKAAFHQGGTSRGIPARPMLPQDTLPPLYLAVMQEEADIFFAAFFAS